MGVPTIQRRNPKHFRRFGCRLPTWNLRRRNCHLNSKSLRCGPAREPREAEEVPHPGRKRKLVPAELLANLECPP